jgi:molybdopterin/thiamine biosynthesis adenylyltransferase
VTGPERSAPRPHPTLSTKHVAFVGVGGLGCPAARVLAQSGVGKLTLLDDDRVHPTNLHRQTLFHDADAGVPKAEVAAQRLTEEAARAGWHVEVVAVRRRILPDNVLERLRDVDLVLEGADNFATKFMIADACHLLERPVVQGGAVGWVGWALASSPRRHACLRCVFEDVPAGPQAGCDEAGVVGPVVGVIGSLQAGLALRLLCGDTSAAGELWSYRGLEGRLRRHRVPASESCALRTGAIRRIEFDRYLAPGCAA